MPLAQRTNHAATSIGASAATRTMRRAWATRRTTGKRGLAPLSAISATLIAAIIPLTSPSHCMTGWFGSNRELMVRNNFILYGRLEARYEKHRRERDDDARCTLRVALSHQWPNGGKAMARRRSCRE